MADMGNSMVTVVIGHGHADDSAVTFTGWVVNRATADLFIEQLTKRFGPPDVESIGTVGNSVQSYQQSVRDGTTVYLDRQSEP